LHQDGTAIRQRQNGQHDESSLPIHRAVFKVQQRLRSPPSSEVGQPVVLLRALEFLALQGWHQRTRLDGSQDLVLLARAVELPQPEPSRGSAGRHCSQQKNHPDPDGAFDRV